MAPPSDIRRPNQVKPRIWSACAGSSVQIPTVDSRVYYFPQGHFEHVAPSSPTLLSSLALPEPFVHCQVTAVNLLADPITDEVFAKLTLQPVHPPSRLSSIDHGAGFGEKEEDENDTIVSFVKILTPSDANNGGGFSVPRFCADSIFPPLDYHAEPPVQILSVADVHGVAWEFRHIYRGTPRRHLLTTGWSKFVNHKRLIAGDSVVFMRNLRGGMFIGIRRAIKSSIAGRGYVGDEFAKWHEHMGGGLKGEDEKVVKGFRKQEKGTIEAVVGAAEKAAQGLQFEVVYYPRAGGSDFVVKAEIVEASLGASWAPGMRVKMAIETEDSSRMTWFQGTISSTMVPKTGLWCGSPWRMLQMSWDEPEILQNLKRVSPWQVELVAPATDIRVNFPPAKKYKFLTHGFLSEGEEEIAFPPRGLTNSPAGYLNPSLLNITTFPAGMQGARQNYLRSFSFTNFMAETTPQMCTESFFRQNTCPGIKGVSTQLNIGSPLSDESSPRSQSSIHSFGTAIVGNRGSTLIRQSVSSFQLFGKIIQLQEPSESGLDESGCVEDGANKAYNDTDSPNNSLDLPSAYPEQVDRVDVDPQDPTVVEA